MDKPIRNPLEEATEFCTGELGSLDAYIRRQLDSDVAMIPAIGNYIISSGGKRLRPLLCILAAKMFSYRGDRHIPLAAVVEFLHTASLLHDDVVDSSDIRRGTPSANGVWGNQASVLVGDFLFSRAFEIMVEDGEMEILQLLAKVSNALAEGEVLQLMRSFHLGMTERQYLEVVERKTAILFSAATEIGARICRQPPDVVSGMAEYGMCVGVAFQLVDDALDYNADEEVVGKPVGHDLIEGKITLPLIHAMGVDKELRRLVERVAERGHYADDDCRRVRQAVLAAGGVKHCLATARDYAARAARALPRCGELPVRSLLADLASFSVQRSF